MRPLPTLFSLAALLFVPCIRAQSSAPSLEPEPPGLKRVVAVENVCAWPNLTLLPDGSIAAVIFNQPGHGIMEGDVECWNSRDGLAWEKCAVISRHEPHTIRMNHAAGLAKNGDLLVLCSGWTDVKQPERPKQEPFRDAVLRSLVYRSSDGGRTWKSGDALPAPESGWAEYIPFGDIWATADGTLRTSCYHAKYVDASKSSKGKENRSWCFRSDDDGLTWKPQAIIGPKHNETDLFPLGSKRWLAAARVEAVELFLSEDDGASWQLSQRVTARNEINGHLARLKDGRLLLSYGIRIKDRCGVCAKLSSDEGKTWSDPLRLAHSQVSDCGYPSSVQLASGKVVTAYYSKSDAESDRYHMGAAVWDAPPQK